MRRWAITLLILGVGSFILPMFGLQFRILSIFGPAQQVVGAILAVAGFLMLLSGFLNRDRYQETEYRPLYEYIPPPNQPPANPTVQPAAYSQNVNYNVPSQGYSQSAPGAAPLYFQAPLPPPPPPIINQVPVPAIQPTFQPTPIGQADLPAFNQAVGQAQAGNTAGAYTQFKAMERAYPYDVNLLLWVAFTSPQVEEARKSVELARSLAPQNPSIAQAEQWLTRKIANQV